MKLFKSKAGFTLIELLVVIGILAVLAAIAIPSVAGLIDRANVSADKTNANEMTNAIERFASEYELYCQDIASGAVQAGNLDSAQGRVYNVLGGATTRAEITALEKPATAGPETTGRAIYRDTKYPVNAETMQAVVENYTKTSSSTFEPKQSDMVYWYSPDCGLVVVAEPTKTAAELDKCVVSGKDAKGNDITSDTDNARWINLTSSVSVDAGNNGGEGAIVEGSAHFSFYEDVWVEDMGGYDHILVEGTLNWQELQDPANGSKFGYNASAITNTSVGFSAFSCCQSLVSITLPNSITTIGADAFGWCENLVSITLPNSITTIGDGAFIGCRLTSITLPQNLQTIGSYIFSETGLTQMRYNGTQAQWNSIQKEITCVCGYTPDDPSLGPCVCTYKLGTGANIQCTDGTIYIPA